MLSQCSPRCCGCVPLRGGVLLIGAALLTAHLLLISAAAALYCLCGDMIRADIWPHLYAMRYLNFSSAAQHEAALDVTDRYIDVLERGLLVALGLSVLGAAACALLLHGARLLISRLLLPWLLLHGCMFVLGTGVSCGGLLFGLIDNYQAWILYSLVGLPVAVVVWYWYVQVFLFYMKIRPRAGRHDAYKMSPLPTSDA